MGLTTVQRYALPVIVLKVVTESQLSIIYSTETFSALLNVLCAWCLKCTATFSLNAPLSLYTIVHL